MHEDELDEWELAEDSEPDDTLVCGTCDSPFHTTAHCDVENDNPTRIELDNG